ncbi:hypothetical protein ACLKA7_004726 [Drosophila subpalustris]
MVLSLNVQQSKLREELELQRTLIDGLAKKTDILDLQERINGLMNTMDRQGKLIDTQGKLIDTQGKLIDTQGKLIDTQGKLIDGVVKASRIRNCAEAKSSGNHDIILPSFSSQPFTVVCDSVAHGGGWTIILRRMDGSINFHRNWSAYKKGFGDLNGEFFLGLDKIHALTAESSQELLVLLEDFEGDERFETYDEFAIGDEDEQYELHTLGKANGTAGDSLSYHRGMKFTTFDKDNDDWEGVNCAIKDTGAWWYKNCHYSQLTGTYRDNGYKKGVNWYHFRGDEYSLKRAIMMIRPKK